MASASRLGEGDVARLAACVLRSAAPPRELLASLVKNSIHMGVKAECAGALWALSQDPKIKTMIARASAIPPLVALLSSTDQRACEQASDGL